MEIAEHVIQGEIFSFSTLVLLDDIMDQQMLFHLTMQLLILIQCITFRHERTCQGEFFCAMQKEMDSQMTEGSIIHQSEIPNRTKIFLAVWQMWKKCNIMTQEVIKLKVYLHFDRSKRKKGVNYDQSYAPVASWSSI